MKNNLEKVEPIFVQIFKPIKFNSFVFLDKLGEFKIDNFKKKIIKDGKYSFVWLPLKGMRHVNT
jgi:hypothetical protein